jgi:hypothetical protein
MEGVGVEPTTSAMPDTFYLRTTMGREILTGQTPPSPSFLFPAP